MSGLFKATASVFAILGCASVILMGTLTAFAGYALTAEHEGETLGIVVMVAGAGLALAGGIGIHMLLRSPRPKRPEAQFEDEGW